MDGEVQLIPIQLDNQFEMKNARVELCVDGIWGAISGEQWTAIDASVVCQEQGFSFYGLFQWHSATHNDERTL